MIFLPVSQLGNNSSGSRHPDERGAVSKNIFFRPFGPQFGLRIRARWWGSPPLDRPLNDDHDDDHQSFFIQEVVSLLHGLPRNRVQY